MEIALLFKMEFWRVNFWRLLVSPPNPPKYPPTKILHYTVLARVTAAFCYSITKNLTTERGTKMMDLKY